MFRHNNNGLWFETSSFWNNTNADDATCEFNNNGTEVPLNGGTEQSYQMFGRNAFRFASLSSSSDTNSLGSSPPRVPYMQPKIRRRPKTQTFCVFCKNNNETPEVFKNHILKDPEGKVVCPVLKKYNCPICNNGGGIYAHTIRYCPKNRAGEAQESVIKALKNGRSADGKKRGKLTF